MPIRTYLLTMLIGAAALVAALSTFSYLSPHQSCVRAVMADRKVPMSAADAHLTCASAFKK